jgi:molecular chaperone GrpE
MEGETEVPTEEDGDAESSAATESDETDTETEPTETQAEAEADAEAEVDPRDEQIQKLRDTVLVLRADADNYRKVVQRDLTNAREYGLQKFAESLLEVADNLDLALAGVPTAELTENKELSSLYDGLRLTQNSLHSIFKKNGIEKFVPEGVLDPNVRDCRSCVCVCVCVCV